MDKFTDKVQTIETQLQLVLIALNKKRRGGMGGYTPMERYYYQQWTVSTQKLALQKLHVEKYSCFYRLPNSKDWKGSTAILWREKEQ